MTGLLASRESDFSSEEFQDDLFQRSLDSLIKIHPCAARY